MWLSGGADEKELEKVIEKIEGRKREEAAAAEKKAAKAKARRRREKMIKQILLTLGYCMFAIGLRELGISIKSAEWWFLMLGLGFYVTFND